MADINRVMENPDPVGDDALARALLNSVDVQYVGELVPIVEVTIREGSRPQVLSGFPRESMRRLGWRRK